MRSIRKSLLLAVLSLGLGAGFAFFGPSTAQAEKLPVDCSGRKSDCTSVRNCTQWLDHVCYEYTTNFWYWYY